MLRTSLAPELFPKRLHCFTVKPDENSIQVRSIDADDAVLQCHPPERLQWLQSLPGRMAIALKRAKRFGPKQCISAQAPSPSRRPSLP